MSADYETTIILDEKGEETGNSYRGDFRVKLLLTRREIGEADQIRRVLLGFNPDGASDRAAADAFVCSQLAVRVIDAPDWFKTAGQGGFELPDFLPLEKLLQKIMEANKARKEKIFGAADKTAAKLKDKK